MVEGRIYGMRVNSMEGKSCSGRVDCGGRYNLWLNRRTYGGRRQRVEFIVEVGFYGGGVEHGGGYIIYGLRVDSILFE